LLHLHVLGPLPHQVADPPVPQLVVGHVGRVALLLGLALLDLAAGHRQRRPRQRLLPFGLLDQRLLVGPVPLDLRHRQPPAPPSPGRWPRGRRGPGPRRGRGRRGPPSSGPPPPPPSPAAASAASAPAAPPRRAAGARRWRRACSARRASCRSPRPRAGGPP